MRAVVAIGLLVIATRARVEAALLARELKTPVCVQWTREDDLHHD